ncbi:MAG: LacI family DNA-binding transcriptional regulator [Bacillota bacterium]
MIATIRDVAKKAGCSITTVSHALNGYDDVNEDTREKILQIAKELNYQPNRIAQHLVTKKFNTIGVFMLGRFSFQEPLLCGVISGLVDEASKSDFDLLLFGTKSLEAGMNPAAMCIQRGAGGVFVMGAKIGDPSLNELNKSEFPAVFFDIPVEGRRATYITSENQRGIGQAVDYLVSLGHRKIGFLNGYLEAWVSTQRLQGYKKAMAKHSLPLKPDYVYMGNFTKESGRLGARQLLEKNPDLTAIIAASDLMATGAMEELKNLGRKIPDQVSVIGFDDLDYASHVTPALTTIRQEKYQMGVMAAKEIMAMANDSEYLPQPHILETSLTIRDSVAPNRS